MRKYLIPRNPISNQLGILKFLPKSFSPHFQAFSEIQPTGQIQEQNDFFRNKEMRMKAIKRKRPEGWISLIIPVLNQYLRLIRAPMGKKENWGAFKDFFKENAPKSYDNVKDYGKLVDFIISRSQ